MSISHIYWFLETLISNNSKNKICIKRKNKKKN